MDRKDITVESDGLKLGWNIVGALSAMGIGLYVYTVLSPLQADIKDIKKADEDTNIKLERLADTVDDRLDTCEINGADIKNRLRRLEHDRMDKR